MSISPHPKFPNLTLVQNPVLLDNLSQMRNKDTSDMHFAWLMDRTAPFVVYEALHDLEVTESLIETPVSPMNAPRIQNTKMAFVSVLGAGEAFLYGAKHSFPWASSGLIAARRDHITSQPDVTYIRLGKDLRGWNTLILDPMLATGGSSSAVINIVKQQTRADNLRLITLVCAPEGVQKMLEDHPDVPIYTLALDHGLNEKDYIIPGLGDAGNRYFGMSPD